LADKITREKETLLRMIKIFCNRHHRSDDELCGDCRDLSEYAMKCLSLCPFGARKPVCGRCPINCFRNDMYAKLITVMRYAGPRMLYKHPVLAVTHLFDAYKKPH